MEKYPLNYVTILYYINSSILFSKFFYKNCLSRNLWMTLYEAFVSLCKLEISILIKKLNYWCYVNYHSLPNSEFSHQSKLMEMEGLKRFVRKKGGMQNGRSI